MRIDEKVFDFALCDGTFHADALECRTRIFLACTVDWIRPPACRPVAALRYPDAARPASHVPLVSPHGDPHLRTHTLICPQQRKVAMGCGAGESLNHSRVGKFPKAGDDVTIQRAKIVERS